MKKWFKRLSPLMVAAGLAGGFAFIGGPASAQSYEWWVDGGGTYNTVTATDGVVTVVYKSDYQGVAADIGNNMLNSTTSTATVVTDVNSNPRTATVTITLNDGVSISGFQTYVRCGFLWQSICYHSLVINNSVTTSSTQGPTTTQATTTTAAPTTATTVPPPPTYQTIKFNDTLSVNETTSYSVGGQTFSSSATKTVTPTNLCVQQMGSANGSEVQLQTCDGGDDQLWKITEYNSAKQIRNKAHQKCIDNRGNGWSGVKVNVWSCLGDNHSAKSNQT